MNIFEATFLNFIFILGIIAFIANCIYFVSNCIDNRISGKTIYHFISIIAIAMSLVYILIKIA